MKYNVQLKVYEGPLDLLYDMISKQKIDIKDISIIDITKQYINYITALEKMDLEIASEFITMASKLLEIKSRYLLYKQKDNNEIEDPRLELMEKLEEYKKFNRKSDNFINHFFEKMLKIKDLMLTDAGKKEAQIRHQFMLDFLYEFFRENDCPEWGEYLKNYEMKKTA